MEPTERSRTISETSSADKRGLRPKDLINVDIFTALYFIIVMAVAMMGYIPIFILLFVAIYPLIGGYSLHTLRHEGEPFSTVFTMSMFLEVLMELGRIGVYIFITGLLFGPLISSWSGDCAVAGGAKLRFSNKRA